MTKSENRLTEVDKNVIHCLNKHIYEQKNMKLQELAEECHVAKSTIVKVAKKMGYSGFVEMQYSMKKKQSEYKASNFFHDLIEDDLSFVLDELSRLIIENKENKNLVICNGKADILSVYLSKKLSMFDIFAPVTYEYSMVSNPWKKRGIAIFCNTRVDYNDKNKTLIELAKKEKYYIIAFYEKTNSWINQYADFGIQIKTTNYKNADFYSAKMLIILEMLFCKLAENMKLFMESSNETD